MDGAVRLIEPLKAPVLLGLW